MVSKRRAYAIGPKLLSWRYSYAQTTGNGPTILERGDEFPSQRSLDQFRVSPFHLSCRLGRPHFPGPIDDQIQKAARPLVEQSPYLSLSKEGGSGRGRVDYDYKWRLNAVDLGARLYTDDAHGLYRRFGFGPPQGVERFLEIARDPSELY